MMSNAHQGTRNGPLAVIVTGLPATGKTSVARRIAAAQGLPLACKDEYKEMLFDTLGYADRDLSRRYGRAANGALMLFLRAQAAAGLPCIIESNFPPEATADLLALRRIHPFRPFQVVCRTRGDVLYARFCARIGRRHPGHGDEGLAEEMRPLLLSAAYQALEIGGTLWELDTTGWATADLAALSDAIGAAM